MLESVGSYYDWSLSGRESLHDLIVAVEAHSGTAKFLVYAIPRPIVIGICPSFFVSLSQNWDLPLSRAEGLKRDFIFTRHNRITISSFSPQGALLPPQSIVLIYCYCYALRTRSKHQPGFRVHICQSNIHDVAS